MQAKSIAECPKGAFCKLIHSTFVKLPFVIKIFIFSNFEWPFYTDFTVLLKSSTDLIHVNWLDWLDFKCQCYILYFTCENLTLNIYVVFN